ncbi:Pal1 cell morphology protein-domain-containing protein [Mariannaea sp. PMI_226]|nr:Pal1 cell morphology protein-domain-containing protein [Mariannaea sp. PMI_226]
MRPFTLHFLGSQLTGLLHAGHASGSGQPSSPGLTLNLSSNNPFRNRAASPANLESPSYFNKPASPFEDPPPRPLSRNPFLDQAPPPLRSPGIMAPQPDSKSKSLSAEEIFDSLTLDDKNNRPKPPTGKPPRRPMDRPPPRRPSDNARQPPPADGQHRPTRSQEEALRARRMQGAGSSRPNANQSPQRKAPPQRRPRRNSESSVMDFDAQPLTEEEKRMIEAKRRERLRNGGGGGSGSGSGKERGKSGRPSRRMDVIDQLDATSIYGTGLFHHDGPFDALNPHRNRNKSRLAPMQAFPKDSLNNSLGGAGPLNAQADHSIFMGQGNGEAFRDYAAGGRSSNRREPVIFDASSRGSIVHGDESHGLGTSTFLEGTPAARSAIARSMQDQAQQSSEGGLQRKKSLAQRFRGINKAGNPNRSVAEGGYTRISPESTPLARSGSTDNNPFFDFSKDEETLTVKPRDPSPPTEARRPSVGLVLERRSTTEATTTLEDGAGSKPSGLLGRMKSLKGGRRPREGSAGAPAPGTAV